MGLSMRLSYFALAIFFIVFATLLMKWKGRSGFNPVAFFTIRSLFPARSLVCMFRLYPCCITAHDFVATAVSILLYYFLMKKLDPDFAKAKERAEIDMDRFEIV